VQTSVVLSPRSSDPAVVGVVHKRAVTRRVVTRIAAILLLASMPLDAAIGDEAAADDSGRTTPPTGEPSVSYDRDVLPIFRRACFGCHQSGKRQGDYRMTDFAALLAGGESEQPAVVPGDPEASYLVEQITPQDGHAAMPQPPASPLSAAEIATIRDWIAEGALDDSPQDDAPSYSAEHPPVYQNAPVITSIDVSHDGRLIAAAAYHEVILSDAQTGELLARLVGLSPRINSVRFSPDSTRLAVAAGTPAEAGELQVWDVAARQLQLSVPLGSDTLSGVGWSPDGSQIALGSANIVRALDANSGQQVLFQGAHEDWVLDTAFTADGSHLVSVARDMTCKLTEVATQRFIDNVTSITPGALAGGLNAIVRHPSRNEIFVGGADGVAKVYQVFRTTARKIGDDDNLIRALPAMQGRIFSVAVSSDGSRLAAAATIDGGSEIRVWQYNFGGATPESITQLTSKKPEELSAAEQAMLAEYRQTEAAEVWRSALPDKAIYAIRFAPDQSLLAAGNSGQLHRFSPAGESLAAWPIVPLVPSASDSPAGPQDAAQRTQSLAERTTDQASEPAIDIDAIVRLETTPAEITLNGPLAYTQMIVTATLADGSVVDVTRGCEPQPNDLLATNSRLRLRPQADGQGELILRLGKHIAKVPVRVSGMQAEWTVDFIRDVNPVLSRLGCNQGSCHGAQDGKNGFKLSLRGYDPIFDIRSLTDDHAARRINPAAPDESLMLRKPLGLSPHQGGTLMTAGDSYHSILRRWIADGSKLDLQTPRVSRIEVTPADPVVNQIGSRQQVRVVAFFADGEQRDVTHEAFITSGNAEVADVDASGLLTTVRRGEAPILARYEGAYAATTLTVMGQREDFQWAQPPSWNRIDDLVATKWERLRILPSELCSDEEFLRRVYLDLTGLPPTSDEIRGFVADATETQQKRAAAIDRLIGSEAFIEFWTNKWADLLQVNRKFLGPEGSLAYRNWIRQSVAENKPYNQFVHEILTASGSNRVHPPASYYKVLRSPDEIMENTTHLFLGIRFNCNKCHDHPFERWTQDQYYQTAAYFARTSLRRDPESGDATIGGTAVEGAKPLYEEVYEAEQGEIKHERTAAEVAPAFPFEVPHEVPQSGSRRDQLAAWLTDANNPYFARSYANRMWAYLLGVGLIEPIDDIRAGNPPTNPELLDHLSETFVQNGFDVRQLMREICNSRTYQLSIKPNQWNEDDSLNYARATPRRLPAEVLFDTIHYVTGSATQIPGVPKGTRAAALPDVGITTEDGFLQNLGQPVRESACECERSSELQLGPVMALVSGPTIGHAIADDENDLPRLVKQLPEDAKLVEELFLRVLGRRPSTMEIETFADFRAAISTDHESLANTLTQREAAWQQEFAQREAARAAALAETQQQLTAKIEELRPEVQRREAERLQRIAAAQDKLEATRAAKQQQWLSRLADEDGVEWFPLVPVEAKASTGDRFWVLEDRSILASGKADKGVYELSFETSLANITGLRIEALTDASLRAKGPGLAANGNFVLTEFEAVVAPRDTLQQQAPVAFSRAVADFTQDGFDPAQAIDGNRDDQQGWAVAGSLGQPHWIVFQAREPIAAGGSQRITIRLHQFHNAPEHRLGRFRISATTAASALLPLGLAEPLQVVLRTPAEDRSAADVALLTGYIESVDKEIKADLAAVAAASAAVPKDPRIAAIEQRITRLQVPTPVPQDLERLRSDVEQSQQQLAQERLTAAEDLTWALINSPAFLFNR